MAARTRTKVPANAVHPGEILKQEFMLPLELTSTELARNLRVSVPRVNDIVRQRRSITADTALRLARYFGTSANLWMGLQAEYDLNLAASDRNIQRVKPRNAA
jgi:addiction module HigA family antidote